MSTIQGTIVAAKITTGDTDSTYSVGDQTEIKGGLHTAATTAIRDSIPDTRREEGMICHSTGNNITYQLKDGITNNDWIQYVINSIDVNRLLVSSTEMPIYSSEYDGVLYFKFNGTDSISVYAVSASKNYLENDPIFTFTTAPSGLSLNGSLTRTEGEDPGEYEILQGTVTNDTNPSYNITYYSNTFIITDNPLINSIEFDTSNGVTNPTIYVNFNQPMDPNTINSDNLITSFVDGL